MKCKYCGAEMPSYLKPCPNCAMSTDEERDPRRSRRIADLVFGAIAAVGLLLGSFYAGQLLAKRPAPTSVPAEEPAEQNAVVIPYTSPDPTAPVSLPSSDSSAPSLPVGPASSQGYAAPSQNPYPVLPTPTARPVLPTPTVRPVLPAPTPQNSCYILPDSSIRCLTEADLQNLSWRELSLARNEIYARHGRRFTKDEIQQYFDSQAWYSGTVDPADFQTGSLSRIENANIKLIKDYETRLYGATYF